MRPDPQDYNDRTLTLEDNYLDGISITVGYPRTHVWSFVAAMTEIYDRHYYGQYACSCSDSRHTRSIVPPFVGNDYFCESGINNGWPNNNVIYDQDPLWDGQDCPSSSSCCQLNNPPWFCKELGSNFTSDVEVRVCGDGSEEVLVQQIELYVQ